MDPFGVQDDTLHLPGRRVYVVSVTTVSSCVFLTFVVPSLHGDPPRLLDLHS